MDEIKVQQNLVYNKYTHQLIGYVDLGDPQLNFSTFNDCNALASYIIVFFLSYLLEYYETLSLQWHTLLQKGQPHTRYFHCFGMLWQF